MTEAARRPFTTLTAADLRDHPVWVACVDDAAHEGCFEPWDRELPVDPDEQRYLVRSQATLADGTWLPALFTPVVREADACAMQPHLLLDGAPFDLDGCALAGEQDRRGRCASALGRRPEDVFPVRLVAVPGLVDGVVTCRVIARDPDEGHQRSVGRPPRRFWRARP